MALTDILNFLCLEDGLCCSGQPTEAQFAEAARQGIEVVINLALHTSDNALPDEAGLVRTLGMEHIHIPVVWEAPQPADLEQFMDAMDAHQGKHILVHCAMNYRATAFLGLWRVLRRGWNAEEAFAPQRQIWSLADYPVWEAFVQKALKKTSG
ncbi:MAG: phosphatase [Anaerolineae bacterium]|nr:MAG: phosphatase [Anaerolineae bacterium]